MMTSKRRWVYLLEMAVAAILLAAIYFSQWAKNWDELMDLAVESQGQGDHFEAEEYFRLALKKAEKEDPEGMKAAVSQLGLAKVYEDREKFTEAEQVYRQALVLVEKLYGPRSPQASDIEEKMKDLSRKRSMPH